MTDPKIVHASSIQQAVQEAATQKAARGQRDGHIYQLSGKDGAVIGYAFLTSQQAKTENAVLVPLKTIAAQYNNAIKDNKIRENASFSKNLQLLGVLPEKVGKSYEKSVTKETLHPISFERPRSVNVTVTKAIINASFADHDKRKEVREKMFIEVTVAHKNFNPADPKREDLLLPNAKKAIAEAQTSLKSLQGIEKNIKALGDPETTSKWEKEKKGLENQIAVLESISGMPRKSALNDRQEHLLGLIITTTLTPEQAKERYTLINSMTEKELKGIVDEYAMRGMESADYAKEKFLVTNAIGANLERSSPLYQKGSKGWGDESVAATLFTKDTQVYNTSYRAVAEDLEVRRKGYQGMQEGVILQFTTCISVFKLTQENIKDVFVNSTDNPVKVREELLKLMRGAEEKIAKGDPDAWKDFSKAHAALMETVSEKMKGITLEEKNRCKAEVQELIPEYKKTIYNDLKKPSGEIVRHGLDAIIGQLKSPASLDMISDSLRKLHGAEEAAKTISPSDIGFSKKVNG